MTTRTLKQPRIRKPRITHCQECGRVLPRRAYRATCATCRKPPEQRRHMRAIYNMRQAQRYRQAKQSA